MLGESWLCFSGTASARALGGMTLQVFFSCIYMCSIHYCQWCEGFKQFFEPWSTGQIAVGAH